MSGLRDALDPGDWPTLHGEEQVGRWFLTTGGEGHGVERQGVVLQALPGARLHVLFFEWMTGGYWSLTTVPLAYVSGWRTFGTLRELVQACEGSSDA